MARKKKSSKGKSPRKKPVRRTRPILLFVVGVSGAGKSTALDTLADSGFFNIDNLPVSLVDRFLQFSQNHPRKYRNLAFLLNIDSPSEIEELYRTAQRASDHYRVRTVFLDSSTEVIIRRYSETRRPHPRFVAELDRTIADAIHRERELLFPLRESAQVVIDTSTLNVHDLRREIRLFVASLELDTAKSIRINFVSFGFKYGIPPDCDLVVDVRFLPNPHFIPRLREQTGLQTKVRDYVLKRPQTQQFLKRYRELLEFLIPQYIFEGKSYLNVGIGCTGGKHRSVVLAEALRNSLKSGNYLLSSHHRDISN